MTKELGRPTVVIMFFIVIYCILNTAVQAIICYSTSSVVCSCHMNLQLLATRVSLEKNLNSHFLKIFSHFGFSNWWFSATPSMIKIKLKSFIIWAKFFPPKPLRIFAQRIYNYVFCTWRLTSQMQQQRLWIMSHHPFTKFVLLSTRRRALLKNKLEMVFKSSCYFFPYSPASLKSVGFTLT